MLEQIHLSQLPFYEHLVADGHLIDKCIYTTSYQPCLRNVPFLPWLSNKQCLTDWPTTNIFKTVVSLNESEKITPISSYYVTGTNYGEILHYSSLWLVSKCRGFMFITIHCYCSYV